ncbi:MAG: hypothetical protein EBX52_09815, partial [Proteobacteria bacterium]|nr:hypothetical protein [Pseudomonadota bacterium]
MAASPLFSDAATSSKISGASSRTLGDLGGDTRFSGSVGLDSSSFFYKSDSRGTSSTTVQATVLMKRDSTIFHSAGDLSLYSFVTNTPAIGVESREFYTQTRAGLLGDVTISVGRKIEPWSKLDGTWRMMSLWSPRWTWDELHPQVVGMTGVYASYSTPNFKATLFGSPIAIPERGTPVSEQNGNIVSSNPFWKPLPSKIKVLGADAPVNYSLIMPPMQDILFRPNFAARVRMDLDSGFFFSANSGVLPVHMVQMAAEPFLSTSGSESKLNVNIRPQFPMRNINTVETGFEDPDHTWNVWASGSYEQPFHFENQDTWLNPIITPSTILSAGTSVALGRDVRVEASILSVKEGPFTVSNKLPNVTVQLPSRFPLKRGFQLGGKWQISELTGSGLSLIQDVLQNNRFISLEVDHAIRASALSIGGGMDVILAKTTQGWVGNYYGDDRVRGWL